MTKQEIVEKLKTELDINQRLFLAGKFHSTEFNKWFNDALTEFEQAVREEIAEMIDKLPPMTRPECEDDNPIEKDDVLALIKN